MLSGKQCFLRQTIQSCTCATRGNLVDNMCACACLCVCVCVRFYIPRCLCDRVTDPSPSPLHDCARRTFQQAHWHHLRSNMSTFVMFMVSKSVTQGFVDPPSQHPAILRTGDSNAKVAKVDKVGEGVWPRSHLRETIDRTLTISWK